MAFSITEVIVRGRKGAYLCVLFCRKVVAAEAQVVVRVACTEWWEQSSPVVAADQAVVDNTLQQAKRSDDVTRHVACANACVLQYVLGG